MAPLTGNEQGADVRELMKPACIVGELAEVTDANASCAINQVPAGGGILPCPIYCDSSGVWVEY